LAHAGNEKAAERTIPASDPATQDFESNPFNKVKIRRTDDMGVKMTG